MSGWSSKMESSHFSFHMILKEQSFHKDHWKKLSQYNIVQQKEITLWNLSIISYTLQHRLATNQSKSQKPNWNTPNLKGRFRYLDSWDCYKSFGSKAARIMHTPRFLNGQSNVNWKLMDNKARRGSKSFQPLTPSYLQWSWQK